MLKKISPWHVALFAVAALFAGFLMWRGAPDTVKLGGAIAAVLVTFLASALGKDDGADGGKGAAMTIALVSAIGLYGMHVAACTTAARETAVVDSLKLAICAAQKCGDVGDVASFGLCLAQKCAAQSVPPEDVIKLFESQASMKRAGCFGPVPSGASLKDAGAEGGAK